MRKTIIIGTIAALFGLATLAQASDQTRSDLRDGTQLTRAAANDSRGDRHDDARTERSREHHDESAEKRHEARQGHDENEAAEHRDRR